MQSPACGGRLSFSGCSGSTPFTDITPSSVPQYSSDQALISQGRSKGARLPLPNPSLMHPCAGQGPELSLQMPAPGTLALDQVSQGPWGQQEGLSCSPVALTLWWPQHHPNKASPHQLLQLTSPALPQAWFPSLLIGGGPQKPSRNSLLLELVTAPSCTRPKFKFLSSQGSSLCTADLV